jgi:hypothetical protein
LTNLRDFRSNVIFSVVIFGLLLSIMIRVNKSTNYAIHIRLIWRV